MCVRVCVVVVVVVMGWWGCSSHLCEGGEK